MEEGEEESKEELKPKQARVWHNQGESGFYFFLHAYLPWLRFDRTWEAPGHAREAGQEIRQDSWRDRLHQPVNGYHGRECEPVRQFTRSFPWPDPHQWPSLTGLQPQAHHSWSPSHHPLCLPCWLSKIPYGWGGRQHEGRAVISAGYTNDTIGPSRGHADGASKHIWLQIGPTPQPHHLSFAWPTFPLPHRCSNHCCDPSNSSQVAGGGHYHPHYCTHHCSCWWRENDDCQPASTTSTHQSGLGPELDTCCSTPGGWRLHHPSPISQQDTKLIRHLASLICWADGFFFSYFYILASSESDFIKKSPMLYK